METAWQCHYRKGVTRGCTRLRLERAVTPVRDVILLFQYYPETVLRSVDDLWCAETRLGDFLCPQNG
jgi:hypothetical protein